MKIDVTGIDPWRLLAALHNHTAPVGMGWLHAKEQDITPNEAQVETCATTIRLGQDPPFYPDYLFGRPIKAFLIKEHDKTYLNRIDLYDRDCPSGVGTAKRIVQNLRL